MRDPLHWLGVRQKLALLFVGVCLLAYGLGGTVVVLASRRALEDAILQGVDYQSQAFGQALAGEIQLLRRRSEDFASDGYIRRQLVRLLDRPEDPETAGDLRRHLTGNKLSLEPAFADLILADPEGHVALRARPGSDEIAPAALEAALAEAAGGGATRVSGFLPSGDGRPRLLVTTPVRDLTERERIVGILAVLLRPDVVLGRALAGALPEAGLAAGHRLQVRDRHGRVLLVPASYTRPGESGPAEGLRLLERGDGVEQRPDLLARSWPVAVAGARVEVFVPLAVALAPVQSLQGRLIALGIVLAGLTGLLLFFPMHFLARPLGLLRDAALRIREGDLDVRVPVRSEDEIGELSSAFNAMAEALGQRNAELLRSAGELRRSRNELRQERDRLDAVLRSLRDGILVVDAEGRTVLANEAARPFLEELRRREDGPQGRQRCKDRRPEHHGCLDCLFDPGAGARSCVVDLGPRTWEIHASPVTGAGSPGGRVLALRDITDRAARDEQQIHQERLAVLGEVAAVVAHELNNPLTSIRMFAQMLEAGQGEDLPETARVILRNVDVCRRTVRELLDYAGGTAPELERVSLEEILDDSVRFLRPLVERHGVRIEREGEEEVWLRGDAVQLRQVFTNLILNAVQAMPGGGTVRIRSARRDGHLVVDLRDDGPGIPEEIRDEIFRPFFTTKPRGEGTGLGLPTARRIAELHGGGLELVETGPGGTWFRVRLRAAAEVPV